jgi:uncharacterized membrane protein YeaQ/YmgE (transglycosylase-associated protein family)
MPPPLYYANKSPRATALPKPPLKRDFLRTAAPLTPTRVVAMLKRACCKADVPFTIGRQQMDLLASNGWIWWIVIGGIAGGIAKLLMPGKDPGGCLVTILLGIAGALVAGFLGKTVGLYGQGEGAGFIAAIVGAFLILLVYRLVLRRRG